LEKWRPILSSSSCFYNLKNANETHSYVMVRDEREEERLI
jgi:hypothetical protein